MVFVNLKLALVTAGNPRQKGSTSIYRPEPAVLEVNSKIPTNLNWSRTVSYDVLLLLIFMSQSHPRYNFTGFRRVTPWMNLAFYICLMYLLLFSLYSLIVNINYSVQCGRKLYIFLKYPLLL